MWGPNTQHGTDGVVDVYSIPWKNSILVDGQPASPPHALCAVLFDGRR